VVKEETGIEAELVRSRGGAFEVTLDGEQIFSKHAVGRFPDQREILEAIWKADPAARAG
jgi:selT/selW/selH-like putative selenoprotein